MKLINLALVVIFKLHE
uniref:Uncharacterized protein n=1 Tax=Anguilla anguilla TaxID=7936 RepID=A0A0E9RW74_ANGAN